MPFQFIDNNATIGPTARRKIRRHAATGKNVGRTIERRSKKGALSSTPTSFFWGPTTIPKANIPSSFQARNEFVPDISYQVGDSLSTLILPVHVSVGNRPTILRGIEFFRGVRYIPEVSSAFDRARKKPSMWIQLIFADEAYFHIAMAVSITAIEGVTSGMKGADREISHLSRSLHLVGQRLSSAEATRDATIAVVAMMAQYERHRRRYPEGLLHLRGLQKMVDMRGGICALLHEHTALGQKIIRLDLEYVMETGSAPLFSMSDVISAHSSTLRPRVYLDIEYFDKIPRLARSRGLSATLRDIAVDMAVLSWLYNDAVSGRRPKISMVDGSIAMWELGYRLLDFRPLLTPHSENEYEDAVYAGLLMFMLPFLHKLDGRVPDCPRLYSLASSVTRGCAHLVGQAADREALLWMLFVGASSAFSPPLDKRLLSIVNGLMLSLDMETWEDVMYLLAGFPWVPVLFDRAGHALFLAATTSSIAT